MIETSYYFDKVLIISGNHEYDIFHVSKYDIYNNIISIGISKVKFDLSPLRPDAYYITDISVCSIFDASLPPTTTRLPTRYIHPPNTPCVISIDSSISRIQARIPATAYNSDSFYYIAKMVLHNMKPLLINGTLNHYIKEIRGLGSI